jgi:hypothetical protein
MILESWGSTLTTIWNYLVKYSQKMSGNSAASVMAEARGKAVTTGSCAVNLEARHTQTRRDRQETNSVKMNCINSVNASVSMHLISSSVSD